MSCNSILCRQVAGGLVVAVQCDLRHGPADAADAVYAGRQAGAAGQVYRAAAAAPDPGLSAAGLSRRTVAHRPLVSGQYRVSQSITTPWSGIPQQSQSSFEQWSSYLCDLPLKSKV